MKTLVSLIVIIAAVTIFSTVALAQDSDVAAKPQETPQQNRGALLRELELTPEQVREIRRANQERKPLMEAAQKRLREANRRLDEAIYADQLNDVDIQTSVKEVQAAQTEVIRIRSMNELSIRRILTPEQLGKFRGLRQRFEAARRTLEERRRQRIDKYKDDPATSVPFREGAKRPRPFDRPKRPKQPIPNQ